MMIDNMIVLIDHHALDDAFSLSIHPYVHPFVHPFINPSVALCMVHLIMSMRNNDDDARSQRLTTTRIEPSSRGFVVPA
jgi:hypothetical protein